MPGVGTRLRKPLTERRGLIDPAVAGVLDKALSRPSTIIIAGCSRVTISGNRSGGSSKDSIF